jgi:protein arginine kinase activator
MLCQHCNKHDATVHVTEISELPQEGSGSTQAVSERHLCERCTQTLGLPHVAPPKKGPINILQMLASAAVHQRRAQPACKQCGMDLEDFRRRGRLGCPNCYQVFGAPVGELLERVHGARQHVGRIPGVSDAELARLQSLAQLRQDLEVAIRQEAYESAARLRDEIQALETPESGLQDESRT